MPPADADQASRKVLVLWDIDYTLIETRGVGIRIYRRAFSAATGQDLRNVVNMAGRTELDIMTQMLLCNGIEPTADAVDCLGRELTAGYAAARDELARTGRVLPGARETLALLARDAAVHQSVLTGNLRAVAQIKLDAFGLAGYLDLAAGAYGEDNHDRSRLVHLAQQRAEASTGVAFPNERTVLIGDTPNDVRAALDAGVEVIAVASGKSTMDELRAAGAERVVADLEDLDQTKRLIWAGGASQLPSP